LAKLLADIVLIEGFEAAGERFSPVMEIFIENVKRAKSLEAVKTTKAVRRQPTQRSQPRTRSRKIVQHPR
jgi:hypothetical protein